MSCSRRSDNNQQVLGESMVYQGGKRPLTYKRGQHIESDDLRNELWRVRFNRRNGGLFIKALQKAGYIKFGGHGTIIIKRDLDLTQSKK